MILFPEAPLAQGKRFGDLWLDTSLIIDIHRSGKGQAPLA